MQFNKIKSYLCKKKGICSLFQIYLKYLQLRKLNLNKKQNKANFH